MSKAHLFSSLDGLVPKSLKGLITYNPRLNLDATNRVVFDPAHPPSQVSIISGGGSGHEPAWSGYVGSNLLAASVAGDVFASPSTKQILAAVNSVPSEKGTLLVITNYTGDCLHFGLAAEKTKAKGGQCRMLICGDDVSIGKTNGALVGRRGLAAQIGVLKILGAASAEGLSVDELFDLGTEVTRQIVSIAATLDHCHVPGRTEHGALGEDEIEIGTGPHNEPGYRKLSPKPSAEGLVKEVLRYCMDEGDEDRGYVHFEEGDETVLMVSNFGGMSNLELGGLVDELLNQLEQDWKVEPVRVYAGCLETSLNAPAFSVSVLNVSAIARASGDKYSVDKVLGYLDLKTDTMWEGFAGYQSGVNSAKERRKRREQVVQPPVETRRPVDDAKDLKVDPATLEKMIRTACEAVNTAEPDLTRWDTIMGDGDCGLTLQTGALALLEAVDKHGLAAKGSVVEVLTELEDIVESKMGGTLGGILGIFFVSMRTALEENIGLVKEGGPLAVWAKAISSALEHLRTYTPAKVGDRTVMDTLIPFAGALREGKDFKGGVEAAVAGAEKTKTLRPRLGRATYVGIGVDASAKELPPDPGAWGAMVAIKALEEALH
ncbi:dihydroxyacetone kinase [Rhypophila decipiens]|uniref:Dihydroxyacetone kinase n=1 Tax=Rhypophila decipiens TaxID=261697 RepID=A0AAN7B6I8_9PEZI|nr:dihydroxyacetone kinase [Rhypophila decipiens]